MSISKSAAKPDTGNGSIMAEVPAAPAPSAGGAVPVAPSAAPSVAPAPITPAQPAATTPESPSTGG
jgi:hypothetical protein